MTESQKPFQESDSEESSEPIGESGSSETSSSKSMKLFVGNLPWETEEDQLESLLEDFGGVTDVNIVYDDRGRSRGFGFVEMASEDAAQQAIDELDGTQYGGRELRVEEAES